MCGKTGSNEKIKPNARLNHNKNLKHISSFSVYIESANTFLVYYFYCMIVYFSSFNIIVMGLIVTIKHMKINL